MSDKLKSAERKVEAQPLHPLPMPEYRYQADEPSSGFVDCSSEKEGRQQDLDLSGVSLNFAV